MKAQELFATRFSGTGAPALPAQGAGSAPGLSTGKSRVSLGKTHQETAENSPGSATKAISSLLCHGDSTELQLQAEDSTILAGKNGVSSPPGLLPGFQHPWMALGSSQEPGSRHRAPQRAFPHYLPTERCYLSLRPASCSIIPEGLPDLRDSLMESSALLPAQVPGSTTRGRSTLCFFCPRGRNVVGMSLPSLPFQRWPGGKGLVGDLCELLASLQV